MDKAVANPGSTPGDPEVRRAEYAEKSHDGNEKPSFARDLVKNYIGGKWVEGTAGRTFDSRNPATGELLGVLTVSAPDDVNKAILDWAGQQAALGARQVG